VGELRIVQGGHLLLARTNPAKRNLVPVANTRLREQERESIPANVEEESEQHSCRSSRMSSQTCSRASNRSYQLETDSLGGNPVLRRLKDNEVLRPADTQSPSN